MIQKLLVLSFFRHFVNLLWTKVFCNTRLALDKYKFVNNVLGCNLVPQPRGQVGPKLTHLFMLTLKTKVVMITSIRVTLACLTPKSSGQGGHCCCNWNNNISNPNLVLAELASRASVTRYVAEFYQRIEHSIGKKCENSTKKLRFASKENSFLFVCGLLQKYLP